LLAGFSLSCFEKKEGTAIRKRLQIEKPGMILKGQSLRWCFAYDIYF